MNDGNILDYLVFFDDCMSYLMSVQFMFSVTIFLNVLKGEKLSILINVRVMLIENVMKENDRKIVNSVNYMNMFI